LKRVLILVYISLVLLSSIQSKDSKEWRKFKKEFLAKINNENVNICKSAIKDLEPYETLAAAKLAILFFKRKEYDIYELAYPLLRKFNKSEKIGLWILKKGMPHIRDPLAKAYVINSLGAYKFESIANALEKFLIKSKRVELIIPFMETLGELHFESSIPVLIKKRSSSFYKVHYGFRKTLFETLFKYETKEVVTFFIKVLFENEGIIADQITQYLTSITGATKGSSKKWKEWLAANKDKFQLKKITKESREAILGRSWKNDTEITYHDIPINGKRVVFVIDTSGSMNTKAGSDVTRMAQAKEELKFAVMQLSKDFMYEIIDFSGSGRPWFKRLIKSHKNSFKLFSNKLRKLTANGGTNSYDALSKAFETSLTTEVIFFLSDGAPSVGEFIRKDDILREIRLLNRFRKITIHTISFARKPKNRNADKKDDKKEVFMEALAHQNDGQHKYK